MKRIWGLTVAQSVPMFDLPCTEPHVHKHLLYVG